MPSTENVTNLFTDARHLEATFSKKVTFREEKSQNKQLAKSTPVLKFVEKISNSSTNQKTKLLIKKNRVVEYDRKLSTESCHWSLPSDH